MKKLACLSAICFLATCSSQTFSDYSSYVSRATPLFLKPAFELTQKDQVLLDVLHHDIFSNVKDEYSFLEESNGNYPEPFESAYSEYRDSMGGLRPTRHRYHKAVDKAAKYLFGKLFPEQVSEEKVEEISFWKGAQKGDLASLLIGIDYKGSYCELQNCIHDVIHINNIFLKPQLKAKPSMTVFMTDNQKEGYYPTKKNISEKIDSFVAVLNSTKEGYFHYSGHGTYLKDTSGDEKDKKDEALVPVDCDYEGMIRDDYLFEHFIRKLNPDVKLTMTTDCCHSGTILDLPYKWKVDGTFVEENKLSEQVLASLPDVVMISGCKDKQVSADGGVMPGQNLGAGAMTAAYLKTLKDYNYVLTYKELLEGIHIHLRQEGFPQKPQLSSTRKLNLDDFFLTQKVALRP